MSTSASVPGPSHDLLVVGSVNADLVVRVDRHPRPGETVLGGDVTVHAGGKGANQAVAAARLGARVAMAGFVGDDVYGGVLLEGLRREGVDVSATRVVDGPSGMALITVDGRGENAITVSPGANGRFGPEAVADLDTVITAAAVVSLQLEIPHATVAEVLARCRGTGTRVVLNMSPGTLDAPAEVLAACDPLVINEHEAGGGSREDIRRRLTRRDGGNGPVSTVVTLGGDGALVAERGREPVHVPAPRVDVVDTTGAGDAFTGALAWRLARGDTLVHATAYAVRAGAAAVTRPGAQASYPRPAELPEAP